MNITMQTTCPNCFSVMNGQSICSRCKFDLRTIHPNRSALPLYQLLHGRYIVGRVLGQGGFGITYAAWDISLNRRCCIKEYMPSEFAERATGTGEVYPKGQNSRPVYLKGRERFITEAKTLYNLRGAFNIVQYLDFFEQNATAYIVMEFLEGYNLRHYVNARGGRIGAQEATQMLLSVGSALMQVHSRGIFHRDISPENIFLRFDAGGKLENYILIDFGAAKSIILAQNGENSVLLKPGYAPPEQHQRHAVLGPPTDIYSLAATYYNVVAGRMVPDAYSRSRGVNYAPLASLGLGVPKKTSDAIDRALRLNIAERFQNCADFLRAIELPQREMKRESGNTGNTGNTGGGKDGSLPNQVEIPKVLGLSADLNGLAVAIPENRELQIGRMPQTSDIHIDEREAPYTISRLHCKVRYDKEAKQFWITDMSVNGTFLEGGKRLVKCSPYACPSGQRFYIIKKGQKYVFEVKLVKAEP